MAETPNAIAGLIAALGQERADSIAEFVRNFQAQVNESKANARVLANIDDGISELAGYLHEIVAMRKAEAAEEDDDEDDGTDMAEAMCAAIRELKPPQITVSPANPAVNVSVPPAQVTVMPPVKTGFKLIVTRRDGNGAIAELECRPA